MSYDDDHRTNRDRGAYTPPTDDDLPFDRRSYDPRRGRGGGGGGPPITLIVSALVLIALIVGLGFMLYSPGVRSSKDAPPAVGTPVGEMKVDAPIDAQPVDPEAGVRVYRDAETPEGPPTFTPGPEPVEPRPAPQPAPVAGGALPPAAPAPSTPAPTPAPAPAAPAPVPAPAPAAPAAGGASGVQIGAFSSTAVADREYAAIAARFPQFASGAEKRVQEVTTSSGSTVYRTTFTGLSRDRAVAFCNALKAAGRDCLVR